MPKAATRQGDVEPLRLYSYEEIGEFAGASARQVKRWVTEGRIGYVQLPKGRRITGEQYREYVESNSVDPEDF